MKGQGGRLSELTQAPPKDKGRQNGSSMIVMGNGAFAIFSGTDKNQKPQRRRLATFSGLENEI